MISWVFGVLGLALLAFMLLSPLESLRWWADKGELEVRRTFETLPDTGAPANPADGFVVYLSGVGTIGGETLSEREEAWLAALKVARPRLTIVDDVFPYSAENRGLLQRTTQWLWAHLAWLRRRPGLKRVGWLINLRNIAQVLVSADPRYGPTHSIGLAHQVWRALQRDGYVAGSGAPVTLIGMSGGAQMALGAGWFLAGLGVPVSMISIGGIFGDDPGLDRLDRLWHLTGRRDRSQLLGAIAFPGRWPTAPLSPWGRAVREKRVTR